MTPGQRLFVKVIRDILSACDPEPKLCLYGNEESPVLYLRLEYDKRYGEFVTRFYERDTMENKKSTKEIKPEKYVGKYCAAKAAVKIVDSIFIANGTSLPVRARDVVLSKVERKRLVDHDKVLDEM